nr:hypothetical protein 3 [Actinidia virus 1]QNH86044.1 hypothetical protein 3 [Actinidia virus 1]
MMKTILVIALSSTTKCFVYIIKRQIMSVGTTWSLKLILYRTFWTKSLTSIVIVLYTKYQFKYYYRR